MGSVKAQKSWRYCWCSLDPMIDGQMILLPSFTWQKIYNKTLQLFSSHIWHIFASVWTSFRLCTTTQIDFEYMNIFGYVGLNVCHNWWNIQKLERKTLLVSFSCALWDSSLSNCSWSHFLWIIPSWYLQIASRSGK